MFQSPTTKQTILLFPFFLTCKWCLYPNLYESEIWRFSYILFSFFSHMQPLTLCKILSVFTPTNVLNISISFHVHCYHHHANHHPLLSRIQPPIGLFILSFVLPHRFVTVVTVIFYYYNTSSPPFTKISWLDYNLRFK